MSNNKKKTSIQESNEKIDKQKQEEKKVKYCPKCGRKSENDETFCPSCGNSLSVEKQTSINTVLVNNQPGKNNGLSIAGFICGLCGLITCGLTSIIGLALSIVGLSQSKKNNQTDGFAIAGIVISSIFVLPLALGFINGFISAIEAEEVEVIDFSPMNKEEAKNWCDSKKMTCNFKEEYSDTIPEGNYIRQDVEVGETIKTNNSINIYYSKGIKIDTETKPSSEGKTLKIIVNAETISVGVGETTTINYTIEPNDVEVKKIEWKTANDKIATVKDGVVTGIKEGETTITLKINDKKQKIKVTVSRTYMKVDIDTMEEERDNNAAAAKEFYKNKYVEVTGRLGVIDSDLKYIGLYSISNKWDLIGINCRIRNQETREMVKTLTTDQTIIVRGKITDVGEVLGYYLDIDEIIPQ